MHSAESKISRRRWKDGEREEGGRRGEMLTMAIKDIKRVNDHDDDIYPSINWMEKKQRKLSHAIVPPVA